jgi:hypothetical protein
MVSFHLERGREQVTRGMKWSAVIGHFLGRAPSPWVPEEANLKGKSLDIETLTLNASSSMDEQIPDCVLGATCLGVMQNGQGTWGVLALISNVLVLR